MFRVSSRMCAIRQSLGTLPQWQVTASIIAWHRTARLSNFRMMSRLSTTTTSKRISGDFESTGCLRTALNAVSERYAGRCNSTKRASSTDGHWRGELKSVLSVWHAKCYWLGQSGSSHMRIPRNELSLGVKFVRRLRSERAELLRIDRQAIRLLGGVLETRWMQCDHGIAHCRGRQVVQ